MDGDDGASLFDGLEFVNPVVLDGLLEKKQTQEDTHPDQSPKDASIPPTDSTAALPSQPAAPHKGPSKKGALDPGLFSALNVQLPAASAPANGVEPRRDKVDANTSATSEKGDPETSSEQAPSLTVRKKKKSIRVGYARDGDGAGSTAELQASLDDLYAAAPQGAPAASSASPVDPAEQETPTSQHAGHSSEQPEANTVLSPDAPEVQYSDAPAQSAATDKDSRPLEEPVSSVSAQEHTDEGTRDGTGEEDSGASAPHVVLKDNSDMGGAAPGVEAKEEQGTGSSTSGPVAGASQAEILRGRTRDVRESLRSSIGASQQKLKEVTVTRKAMVQRKREAAQALVRHLAALQTAEAEVAAACEREDFEAADTLSQQAEELQRDADGARVAYRFAEEECAKLLEELHLLAQAEVDAEAGAVAELESICQDAAELSREAEQAALERAKEDLERVQVEEESMEAKKRKVALERRVLEEQEAELAARVDGLTQAEREEKEKLLEAQQQLEQEREALMELVRAKDAEIQDQRARVAAVDGRIGAVAARFDKVRAEMEAERERVEAQAQEVVRQEQALAQARQEVEEVAVVARREAQGLGEVIEEASAEMVEARERAERKRAAAQEGQSLRRRMAELAEEEKAHGKDAEEIAEGAAALRAEEKELAAKVSRLQQEAADVARRLAVANQRIPELEAEKKQAASARNFKEAARLAAEAKLLANDRAAATEQESTVQRELQEAAKETALKAEQTAEIESMCGEKKRAAALARCTRLFLEAGALRKEMEAAAEMEDFDEAECLQLEAEAADKEVEHLCALHGISHDEMAKLADPVQETPHE